MVKLTKAETNLLTSIGVDVSADDATLAEEVRQAYYVWDEAPFPYWERKRAMDILANVAGKLGYTLDEWDPTSIHQVF